MLDEMRQAALVVVFEDGPGLDDQPEFDFARGLRVRPDVETETVGQRPDEDLRIDRHIGRKRVVCDRCGGCFAAGCSRGLRGQLASNEQAGYETGGRPPEQA